MNVTPSYVFVSLVVVVVVVTKLLESVLILAMMIVVIMGMGVRVLSRVSFLLLVE